MKKVDFSVKVNDEELSYFVREPDAQTKKRARELKLDYFRENAFKEGTVFSHQILDLLKKKGLWSDEKEEEIKSVTRELEEKIRFVSKGKSADIPTKDVLREKIVKEIKPLRTKQLELYSERAQLDSLSIESAAQQLEFDYLVTNCTRTNMDDVVYKSLDDYKAKADEPYTELAGKKLAELIGQSDPEWWTKLPENKLLIKCKFMDAKGRYLNSKGELVNLDGKRINEDGFLINDKDEPIDEFGNLINSEGEVIGFVDFDE